MSERYHQLLLNHHNAQQHDSILKFSNTESRIYGIKFIVLLLCQTIILTTREVVTIKESRLKIPIINQSYLTITLAFIVSSYSSFIGILYILQIYNQGHKKLFIGSFILFSLCYFIQDIQQSYESLLMTFFVQLFREILNIQMYIQMCGYWPSQFTRVLVEMLTISLVVGISISQHEQLYNNIFWMYILAFPMILLLCFRVIGNFNKPNSSNIHLDIIKALFHYKPLIFSILFASSLMQCLLQVIQLIIQSREIRRSEREKEFSYYTQIILTFILVWKSRTLKLQTTLIYAIVITLIWIVGLILYTGVVQVPYALTQHVVTINMIFYCIVYIVPQYQVILMDIQIKYYVQNKRNLDIASSYLQFALIMIESTISLILHEGGYFLADRINLLFPLSIGAIPILGLIFYWFLGLKYFYKCDGSQFESQELATSDI